MGFGFIIFIFILLYYFLIGNTTDPNKIKHFIVFGCVLFILESGLRHICVGPDTCGYYATFCLTRDGSWSDAFKGLFVSRGEWRDNGFKLFIKIISTIIPSWQLFLIAIASFFYYAYGKLLYVYLEDTLSVLFAFALCCCLFHVIALSGVRQQITMSISLLVVPMLEKRKWKSATILILLFSTVHISILAIFLFYPFFIIRKFNYGMIHSLAIVSIPFVAVFARSIVGFLASFLANDYYSHYADSESQDFPIVYVLLFSAISCLIRLKIARLNVAPRFYFAATILMTLAVPLILLDGTMLRLGQYFTIYMSIVLPHSLSKDSNKNIIYSIMILILFVYLAMGSTQYAFFWEESPVLSYWGGY